MIGYTCANCERELQCEKNMVPVVHFIDNDKTKGIDAVRYGDIYRCPNCGCRVALGMGSQRLGLDIMEKERYYILKEHIEVKI